MAFATGLRKSRLDVVPRADVPQKGTYASVDAPMTVLYQSPPTKNITHLKKILILTSWYVIIMSFFRIII